MNLLGISGKKQTGKNTIASIIAQHLIPKKQLVFEVAFADSLKEEVCKACGITLKELEANKSMFRPILQWWGTDYRRNYKGGETYWIDQLLKKLVKFPNDCTVIVTDVRFPNEANLIKQAGGQLWRVCRIHKDFSELDGHHSEIALDDYQHFDEVITNNATTVEELKPKIINLYNKYYGNNYCTIKITAEGKPGTGKSLMLNVFKKFLAEKGIKSYVSSENTLTTENIETTKIVNLYGNSNRITTTIYPSNR